MGRDTTVLILLGSGQAEKLRKVVADAAPGLWEKADDLDQKMYAAAVEGVLHNIEWAQEHAKNFDVRSTWAEDGPPIGGNPASWNVHPTRFGLYALSRDRYGDYALGEGKNLQVLADILNRRDGLELEVQRLTELLNAPRGDADAVL